MGTFAKGKGKDLDTCYSAAYIACKSSLCIVEMGANRTRTELELTWRKHMELEPNRTHQCDEPEPSTNLPTQVLVGFDKFVD